VTKYSICIHNSKLPTNSMTTNSVLLQSIFMNLHF